MRKSLGARFFMAHCVVVIHVNNSMYQLKMLNRFL